MASNESRELESLEEVFVRVVDDFEDAHELGLYETRSRAGIFAPALVMWLMISQRLQQRRSLAGALESLSRGESDTVLGKNQKRRKTEASLATGGLCRARERLQIETVRKVIGHISEELIKESVGEYRWRGKVVVIVDGTTIELARSERTVAEYGVIRNQNGESHNPHLLCLCGHELFSGVGLMPHFGPYRGDKAVSEQRLFHEMVDHLPQESLVVLDRLYGRITTVMWTHSRGHQILVRLPSPQAKTLAGKAFGKKDFDVQTTWRVTPKVAERYDDIPEGGEVGGRIIQYTVRRPGFRPMTLWFFTTSAEPASDLLNLYLQRERIENDIRSLKYVLGLEMLLSKSPDVIEKELLLGYAAYNLMRSVIAKAAKRLKIMPRQLSFSRAASLTQIFGNKLRLATTRAEEKKILTDYLRGLSQSKLPNRTMRRIEPRKCVRHKDRFPLMRKSREAERKAALETAQKHGHRGYFTTVTRKF